MRLNKRERNMAMLLGIFLGGWLLYTAVVGPASARAATLQRVIPEKAQSLEILKAKCNEYVSLNNQISKLKTKMAERKVNFNLMRYLEVLTAHHNLTTQQQKPMTTATYPLDNGTTWQEQIATINFTNITVKQMIEFLTEVKADSDQTNAQTKAVQIEKNSTTPNNINATLQIAILQPAR